MTSPEDAPIVDAVILLARMKGCTCDPDVTIERHPDGIAYARMAHDHWCPLLLAHHAHNN